jgi:trans-2,3-dihydro-3-hydroxyanthranilate isomerase
MRFYLVDVFSENKYQGNQLAVFIVENNLSAIEMQKIAREVNFSETTFIVSDKKADLGYDVRIFTPDVEIPFAGHPTLGTAFVISQVLEKDQSSKINLNLGIGQIPVTFTSEDKTELWMQQIEPSFKEIIPANIISEILHLNEDDINTIYPIQVVSTGLPAVIVPVKKIVAVKKCFINHQKYQSFLNEVTKANFLIFTPEVQKKENDLHVRVFMDDPGFLEDPATGSANGNLAGFLLEYNFFKRNSINIRIEQGYEIGRPSLLKIKAEKIQQKFSIQVGGKCFLVAKGEWF